MGGDQVGNDILLLPALFIHLLKQADKFPIDRRAGLAHPGQDIVGDMLRRDPELAADMILAQFPQKSPVGIRQQIVIAESGPDKDLFDTGERPELS